MPLFWCTLKSQYKTKMGNRTTPYLDGFSNVAAVMSSGHGAFLSLRSSVMFDRSAILDASARVFGRFSKKT